MTGAVLERCSLTENSPASLSLETPSVTCFSFLNSHPFCTCGGYESCLPSCSLVNVVESCWQSPGYGHAGRKSHANVQFRALAFLSAHARLSLVPAQPLPKHRGDCAVSQRSRPGSGEITVQGRKAGQREEVIAVTDMPFQPRLRLLVPHLLCSAG